MYATIWKSNVTAGVVGLKAKHHTGPLQSQQDAPVCQRATPITLLPSAPPSDPNTALRQDTRTNRTQPEV